VLRIVPVALLVSVPALAASATAGAEAFSAACTRCHAATRLQAGQRELHGDRTNARPGAGPDLTEALLSQGYDQVRSWIQKPGGGRRETSCDTRQVSPAQLDDLMAYLVGQVVPDDGPRKERLKRTLSDEQARAVAAGVPTDRAQRGGRRR
jgi:mono/diheme cytochrome c family protein